MSPNRDGLSSYTLAGTVQTKPNILSPVAHSSTRRQREDGFHELLSSLNEKLAKLGAEVVQQFFPQQTSRLQALRQMMVDAPLFGTPDNHSFSTAQLNISTVNNAHLATSIGSAGDSHIDRHDDLLSLSLLLCLSLLDVGTHPGEFYLGETQEWYPLRPFSLLIFHGTGPHSGTQPKPSSKPKEWEKRINAILYPRREFVNRTVDLQWPCYEATRLSDYSFFHDGAACFGTKEYHQAWCSRELFRHFVQSNKQFGHPLDDAKLQQAFKLATGSDKRYIDPNSDDGKAILNTVTEANRMLECIRPPWKEPRKEKGTGATDRQQGQERDERPSPKPRTAKQPATPGPKTDSRNQDLDVARRQSRLRQKPTPQQSGRDSESDGSSSVATAGSDYRSTDKDLGKVLLKWPLFDVTELDRELQLLKEKASLCPPKFRDGRMPRMSTQADLGRVASARPLPDTLGSTVVEEMIQIGELSYWITQKNEQMWFYQRVLSQELYTALLRVKPIFELVRLKWLFKDRRRSLGWGICSRKLVDAVIEMVENASAPGGVGKEFLFDAKKILGDQYQPKFCSSVKVVMTPYLGPDIYAHQARHFREVVYSTNFEPLILGCFSNVSSVATSNRP